VAQDIAHHLQVGPAVNLPAGVTVSESMRPHDLRRDSGAVSVVADAMPKGTAGNGIIRHQRPQKDLASFSMTWTFRAKINGQCSGHAR
jgi:hypothetical protein